MSREVVGGAVKEPWWEGGKRLSGLGCVLYPVLK